MAEVVRPSTLDPTLTPYPARTNSMTMPNLKPLSPTNPTVKDLLNHAHTTSQQETPPLTERKQRKSVAFSEGTTIMDENGDISAATHGEDKTTAESHSRSLSEQKQSAKLTLSQAQDKAVDEVTDMFAGLNKKKKKSSKPKPEDAAEAEAPAAAADDFESLGLKKKKKKSTKPKTEDDFDAKLASAGVEEPSGDANGETAHEKEIQEEGGDPDAGTGVWAHNSTAPITYPQLLHRFFTLLNQFNPDILASGSRSYKIPPPQCLREGNKKTIFANIAEICKRMKRNDEHVTQFLFAELGTSGSVDGSKRLVIKGRFQQKQIENVLRRYIGKCPSQSLSNTQMLTCSS